MMDWANIKTATECLKEINKGCDRYNALVGRKNTVSNIYIADKGPSPDDLEADAADYQRSKGDG